VAQGEVLQGELAVAAAKEGEETQQVEQEGNHQLRILSGSELTATTTLPTGWSFGEGHYRHLSSCYSPEVFTQQTDPVDAEVLFEFVDGLLWGGSYSEG
jgi:hypothetical protein